MTLPHALQRYLGSAALALGLGASAIAPAIAQEITIKYANVMAPSHDTSKGVDKFAELVAQIDFALTEPPGQSE